jgi:hypothetical protein
MGKAMQACSQNGSSSAIAIPTRVPAALPAPAPTPTPAATPVLSADLAASRELGAVELEFSAFRSKFDGGYFSVSVATTHQSGDKLNFIASSQKGDNLSAILSVHIKGADALNASSIALLSDSGVPLLTKVATCQYAGMCNLSLDLSMPLVAGVYQAYLDTSHNWTLRVTYSDGTQRESKLVLDKSLVL